MLKTLSYIFSFVSLLGLVSCSHLPESLVPTGVKGQQDAFHTIWTKNTEPPYDSGNLPIALQSPLIHQGVLYVGDGKERMNAFELENGRKIWQTQDKGQYHVAPVVFKESILYGTVEGRFYSRNLITGKADFSVDLGASVESPAVVYKGRVYLHLRNHKIYCLDAATGKILWAYKRNVPHLTTLQRVSKPFIHQGKLFVGFADGQVVAFSAEDGLILWEQKLSNATKFVDVDTNPVIFKGNLLMGSMAGTLTLLNPKNGNILRKFPYTLGRSPLVWKDRLILGTVSGELVLIDGNYAEVKKVKISEGALTSMTWWKNDLIVSSVKGELFKIDTDDFSVMSKRFLGHNTSAVFGSIISKEKTLAVLSSRHRLYVFK